MTVTQLHR